MGEKVIWKPGNMLYPLPVVLVSCMRPGERPNLITLAWAGTVCSDPPMVSISVRKERYSYDIIRETGVFAVNLTTEAMTYATDFCGVKSGRDIDKFAATGLTAAPGTRIPVPIVAESPVSMECRVAERLELGSHDMFVGEIVAVQADAQYMDEKGKFDLLSAKPIAYSHGTYVSLGESLGTFGYSVRKNSTKNKKG